MKLHDFAHPWAEIPHPAEVRAADALGGHLDSMVAAQMQAYPDSWPEADKREMAERHLFGERAA